MPATAVAQQLCAAEYARRREEDYSAVIRLMEDLAGIAETSAALQQHADGERDSFTLPKSHAVSEL